MKFTIRPILKGMFMKHSEKQTTTIKPIISSHPDDENWQTSKKSPALFDQGAVPIFLGKEESGQSTTSPPLKKVTKIKLVKTHLINNGSIDSWTAITFYRATRLSAIIYILKNTHGMNIESIINSDKSHFATYVLHPDDYVSVAKKD
jgi:hypothetical protein